jgi:hypothetical protein
MKIGSIGVMMLFTVLLSAVAYADDFGMGADIDRAYTVPEIDDVNVTSDAGATTNITAIAPADEDVDLMYFNGVWHDVDFDPVTMYVCNETGFTQGVGCDSTEICHVASLLATHDESASEVYQDGMSDEAKMQDGNYATATSADTGDYVLFNYTEPVGYDAGTVKTYFGDVTGGSYLVSYAIPAACWDSDDGQLHFKINYDSSGSYGYVSTISCGNASTPTDNTLGTWGSGGMEWNYGIAELGVVSFTNSTVYDSQMQCSYVADRQPISDIVNATTESLNTFDTPANTYDGDWSTYSDCSALPSGICEFYWNYSVSPEMSDGYFQYKTDLGLQNGQIPATCFGTDTLNITGRMYDVIGMQLFWIQCLNPVTGGYEAVGGTGSGTDFYEANLTLLTVSDPVISWDPYFYLDDGTDASASMTTTTYTNHYSTVSGDITWAGDETNYRNDTLTPDITGLAKADADGDTTTYYYSYDSGATWSSDKELDCTPATCAPGIKSIMVRAQDEHALDGIVMLSNGTMWLINRVPSIGTFNATSDSGATTLVTAGSPVDEDSLMYFNAEWNDDDGESAKLYICNDSNFISGSGCQTAQICVSSFAQETGYEVDSGAATGVSASAAWDNISAVHDGNWTSYSTVPSIAGVYDWYAFNFDVPVGYDGGYLDLDEYPLGQGTVFNLPATIPAACFASDDGDLHFNLTTSQYMYGVGGLTYYIYCGNSTSPNDNWFGWIEGMGVTGLSEEKVIFTNSSVRTYASTVQCVYTADSQTAKDPAVSWDPYFFIDDNYNASSDTVTTYTNHNPTVAGEVTWDEMTLDDTEANVTYDASDLWNETGANIFDGDWDTYAYMQPSETHQFNTYFDLAKPADSSAVYLKYKYADYFGNPATAYAAVPAVCVADDGDGDGYISFKIFIDNYDSGGWSYNAVIYCNSSSDFTNMVVNPTTGAPEAFYGVGLEYFSTPTYASDTSLDLNQTDATKADADGDGTAFYYQFTDASSNVLQAWSTDDTYDCTSDSGGIAAGNCYRGIYIYASVRAQDDHGAVSDGSEETYVTNNLMYVENTVPVIGDVLIEGVASPTVDPTESGFTEIEVTANITDYDIVNDATELTGGGGLNVTATSTYFGVNTTCDYTNESAVGEIGCKLTFPYNATGGSKTVTVEASDLVAAYDSDALSTFTYSTIYAVALNDTTINFGSILKGTSDNVGDQLLLDNSGNGIDDVNITGSDLVASSYRLTVGNMTIDDDLTHSTGNAETALTTSPQDYSPNGATGIVVDGSYDLWFFLDVPAYQATGAYTSETDFQLVPFEHI